MSSMEEFLLVVLLLEGSILIIGFFGLLKIILWISETFKTVLYLF